MKTRFNSVGLLSAMLILIALIPVSCTKIKYGDFTITSITVKSFNGNSTEASPHVYFKCKGPGVQDISNNVWIGSIQQEFIVWTDFHGKRGSASYDFTLMEDLNSGDQELKSTSVDFGKFKGQSSFTVEQNDMVLRFLVSWDSRW